MTVLGDSTTPSFGHDTSSSFNQLCPHTNNMTAPALIIVTKIWVHVGGTVGTVAGCKFCLWGTGGSLIFSSQTLTLPSGRQWVSVIPTSPPILSAATNFYAGVWAPTSSNLDWGIRSSGHYQGRSGIASPSTMTGSTDDPVGVAGEMGGYIEYILVGGKIRRSGAWNTATTPVQLRRSAAWVQAPSPKVRRAPSWIDPS